MKLLNKTIVYYLLFALPVFAVCSLFIYHFVSVEIKDELDENLWKEKTETEQKLSSGIKPEMIRSNEVLIEEYLPAATPSYSYSDTSLYNAEDEEILPYRILNAYTTAGGHNYRITVRQSYVESDDLISSILIPIISMFVVLLAGFLFINYWIARKLWNPFYRTIEQLKAFELGRDGSLQFSPGTIREFNDLNRSISLMTQKARKDYLRQKEFTENASHEIQTPLAIIQNKIELLIQSKSLGEKEMKLITGIYESAGRLSHLNKTLLLLTKIENNQFRDHGAVDLQAVIDKCAGNYRELAAHKKIKADILINSRPVLMIHSVLCETLFNNLILNAIRHNSGEGTIRMELYQDKFMISNSGAPLSVSSDELFERFKKDTSSGESTGLGLSIVQSICTLYGYKISHSYSERKHTFTLSWPVQ